MRVLQGNLCMREEQDSKACKKIIFIDNYALCVLHLLKPKDIYIYIYRTAVLTSRRYILNIYSTNIHTEYFKHAA